MFNAWLRTDIATVCVDCTSALTTLATICLGIFGACVADILCKPNLRSKVVRGGCLITERFSGVVFVALRRGSWELALYFALKNWHAESLRDIWRTISIRRTEFPNWSSRSGQVCSIQPNCGLKGWYSVLLAR